MTGLLQVALYTPDGRYISDPKQMAAALEGSDYLLDLRETEHNDNIAMIITRTEWEAQRLLEEHGDDPATGRWRLPSGYQLEVPKM